jgi:hypothetical protein
MNSTAIELLVAKPIRVLRNRHFCARLPLTDNSWIFWNHQHFWLDLMVVIILRYLVAIVLIALLVVMGHELIKISCVEIKVGVYQISISIQTLMLDVLNKSKEYRRLR